MLPQYNSDNWFLVECVLKKRERRVQSIRSYSGKTTIQHCEWSENVVCGEDNPRQSGHFLSVLQQCKYGISGAVYFFNSDTTLRFPFKLKRFALNFKKG